MGPMGPAGFRRRGRRRGLIAGAAIGASVASRNAAQNQPQAVDDPAPDAGAPDATSELTQLKSLFDQQLITEEEYAAKKKQILGI